jgi:hypothetical protein
MSAATFSIADLRLRRVKFPLDIVLMSKRLSTLLPVNNQPGRFLRKLFLHYAAHSFHFHNRAHNKAE